MFPFLRESPPMIVRIGLEGQAHGFFLQPLELGLEPVLLLVRQRDDRGDLEGQHPLPFVPGRGRAGRDFGKDLQAAVLARPGRGT